MSGPVNLPDAMNKLCKWRTVLAGWSMGTRSINAPGASAARDLADKWLIIRAELNAMMGLLLTKGILTRDEYEAAMMREVKMLDQDMASQFPGFRSTPIGIEIFDIALANQTMTRLNFPP